MFNYRAERPPFTNRTRCLAQARKKPDPGTRIDILRHVKYGLQESSFLLLSVVALYLLLSLFSFDPRDPAWTHTGPMGKVHNLGGVSGAWFADIALYFIGFLSYFLPIGLLLAGWTLFRRGAISELDAETVVFRSIGVLVTLFAGCGLASLHLGVPAGYLTGSAGGILGDIAGSSLVGAFSFVGGTLFLLALFLAGVTLATGLSWLGLLDLVGKLTLDLTTLLGRAAKGVSGWLADRREDEPEDRTAKPPSVARHQPPPEPPEPPEPPMVEESSAPRVLAIRRSPPVMDLEPMVATREAPEPDLELRGMRAAPEPEPEPELDFGLDAPWDSEKPSPAPAPAPAPVAAPTTSRPKPRPTGVEARPPLALLDPVKVEQTGYSAEDLETMSRQVEVQLQHFGIEVRVVAVEPGPVITRFELEPAPGVKVSQISNLSRDLARGLSVISVRVVDIIPGKSVVGLEIPNRNREVVYLSEVLGAPVYTRSSSPLTLALGKDIGGNPVVANLAKMPHLLVAGTTGSGKSVAINAMLLSMLYKTGPEEVRLILVDPKMLELSIYEGVPHLLAPVVTDMKEAANALRWCVAEMERRYRLMAALKVRNILGFNKRVTEAQETGEPIIDPLWKAEEHVEGTPPPALEPLPYIVVVIDELADMMMIVGKKVEELIARLAQKARASGIHLILATQRPSVDVITGLIKANIPTRIAFQVSSRVDSRTILDQMGAEQLLGHGDMLYLPPGTGFPQRVHGAFVDDHEVHKVVEYLKQTGEPEYLDVILEESQEAVPGLSPDNGGADPEEETDALYDQAVRIVTESRKASISYVQRRLKIGYNRAARMVEEMERAGVVGPLETNGSREVLAPPPPEV